MVQFDACVFCQLCPQTDTSTEQPRARPGRIPQDARFRCCCEIAVAQILANTLNGLPHQFSGDLAEHGVAASASHGYFYGKQALLVRCLRDSCF